MFDEIEKKTNESVNYNSRKSKDREGWSGLQIPALRIWITHGLMNSFEGMTFHIISSFFRISSSSTIHTKWIRWWEWVGGGISAQFQL